MSVTTRRPIGYALILLVVIAWVVAVQPLPRADAHWQQPQYSWNSGCSKRIDPISLVYYGSAAVNHRVFRDIGRHTGWDNRGGSSQYIHDHGGCSRMYDSLASGCDLCSRTHVRLWTPQDRDAKGRWETVGTPHHEDWVWSCFPPNHAVDKGTKDDPTREGSGFDQGRRTIRKKVNTRHHEIDIVYWGNTRSFKQCDDDWAGSNGNVLWVSFGRH